MKRYCITCHSNVEFDIKSLEDMDNLVCPNCGAKVDKNSKEPKFERQVEKSYNTLGAVSGGIFSFFFVFYLVCAIVGIVAFCLKMYPLLYIMTAINVIAYIIQWLIRYVAFVSGVVFLPLGAVVGFIIWHSLAGACVGIMIVFAIRHVLRDLLFMLVGALVKAGNR